MAFDICNDPVVQRMSSYFPFIVPLTRRSAADSRPATPPPHQQYGVMRRLGQGSMATVFLARRLHSEGGSESRLVALKFIENDNTSISFGRRTLAERKCLEASAHISLLQCYETHTYPCLPPRTATDDSTSEIDTSPTAVVLVVEYCDSGDLSTELKRRRQRNEPFQEYEALNLFLQVVMAVHNLHQRSIMHRDIKSSNILLCAAGIVKLADFGFSKEIANGDVMTEQVGSFCGTPFYLAPELWERRAYSGKADMFSLGVLLYELLTLRRPFDDQTEMRLQNVVITGAYEPLGDRYSAEVRELVDELLAPDSQDRPDTFAALSRPIMRLALSSLLRIAKDQTAGGTTPSLTHRDKDRLLIAVDDVYNSVFNYLPCCETPLNLMSTHTKVMPFHSMGSSFSSLQSATILPTDDNHKHEVANTVFLQSVVQKEHATGVWKQRQLMLCMNHASQQVDVVLSTTSFTSAVRFPLQSFRDVFPVPASYARNSTPTTVERHLFVLLGTDGKRHAFSVGSTELRNQWIQLLTSCFCKFT